MLSRLKTTEFKGMTHIRGDVPNLRDLRANRVLKGGYPLSFKRGNMFSTV